MTPTPERPDGAADSRAPESDVLLELHRELWAAQRRQALATPGTRERADADGAVAWFEWLLVDYLQRMPGDPGLGQRPFVRPAA